MNAVADAAPGFVWRLQTEDGDATAVRGFEPDAAGAGGGVVINMSVWESVEALAATPTATSTSRCCGGAGSGSSG